MSAFSVGQGLSVGHLSRGGEVSKSMEFEDDRDTQMAKVDRFTHHALNISLSSTLCAPLYRPCSSQSKSLTRHPVVLWPSFFPV